MFNIHGKCLGTPAAIAVNALPDARMGKRYVQPPNAGGQDLSEFRIFLFLKFICSALCCVVLLYFAYILVLRVLIPFWNFYEKQTS